MSFKIIKSPTTITLRNPDFDDTIRLDMGDIKRRTQNRVLKVYCDADWPRMTLHIWKFSRLKNVTGATNITTLRAFFTLNAGLLITVIDHFGATIQGVVWTPVEIIATRPNCSFDMSLEFMEIPS